MRLPHAPLKGSVPHTGLAAERLALRCFPLGALWHPAAGVVPRTAGLVALVPLAQGAVQKHSVSECAGSLHEGAPTLLAVVPHLHATPSGSNCFQRKSEPCGSAAQTQR